MSKLIDRLVALRSGERSNTSVAPVNSDAALSSPSALDVDDEQANDKSLMLSVDQIHVGPQARKRFNKLELLAADIKARGLLQPIVVRELSPHQFLLLAGERRLRAVRDVLKQNVIAARLMITAVDEQHWRLSQLAENLQREDYEPLELAREFATLKAQFGYTDTTLADALHVSRTWVWKQVSLLSAPEAVQRAIDEGRLAATDYLNNKAMYSGETPGVMASPTSGQSSESDDEASATRRTATASVQRIPTVALPTPSTLAMAKLLQVLAEKRGLSPITLGINPTKKELAAIVTTRVAEILNAIKTDTL